MPQQICTDDSECARDQMCRDYSGDGVMHCEDKPPVWTPDKLGGGMPTKGGLNYNTSSVNWASFRGARPNTYYGTGTFGEPNFYGGCCEWCDDNARGNAIKYPPVGCNDTMCSDGSCSGKGYGKLTSTYALTPYPAASTWEQASGHSCQNGGECQCGGQCKGGYSNVEGGIPPDPAGLPAPGSTPTQVANDPGYLSVQNDGSVVDAQGNVTTPPQGGGMVDNIGETVKANLLKTDAADEGYVVSPLRKKFEPYIIGGLVAVGVLFLFGMVKVGSQKQN